MNTGTEIDDFSIQTCLTGVEGQVTFWIKTTTTTYKHFNESPDNPKSNI